MKPLARFVAFATAGCPPEEMGIGPVFAIPKALKLAGLTLDQIDVIELNEAFAAQSLTVIKVAGLDPARVNLNGGADRARPSARMHGRETDGVDSARTGAPQCALRHGDDVRRRRHGRRRNFRARHLIS